MEAGRSAGTENDYLTQPLFSALAQGLGASVPLKKPEMGLTGLHASKPSAIRKGLVSSEYRKGRVEDWAARRFRISGAGVGQRPGTLAREQAWSQRSPNSLSLV